ncbi:MAG: HD domain-containing protein [Lachnospiraceae bacterium]|nr:HD domain-containing protein [Lachnospiraceae bacterium]
MSTRELRSLPAEYLWDGLVLNEDIFNHTGTVLLLPKGETITRDKLNKLMGFYGEDKNIMVYEETYLEIMNDEHLPIEARQKLMENHVGYTRLQQNIGALFDRTDYDSWLSTEKMAPMIREVAGKIRDLDPVTILSCINFPRPMDEGLQRHSLNVALLNGMQAEWLELPPDDVNTLVLAGLLHDIGKTMIPEEILNAPRKLTDEELKIMRNHPIYSDELLTGKFDDYVRLAARHHHEKLNGTGYPDGIADEEIGICARITSISDIYDAMVSARSYKGARLPLDVFDMLYQEKFDGLDRSLVISFLKNMRARYTNRQVVMSNGRRGEILYIPLNDADHPIIRQGDDIRQTDDEWYCKEILAAN